MYLRLPPDLPYGDWDALPASLVNDAAQLVKANSIEGKRTGIMLYLSIKSLTDHLLEPPLRQQKNSLTVRGHLLLLQPHVPRLKIQCADYLYALVKSQGLYRSK